MADTEKNEEGLDDIIEQVGDSSDFDWGADELEEETGDEFDVLRFAVGSGLFAIEGEFVREVVGDIDVTPLPGAPPHIAGIGMLKRQVIGVLDLLKWFGLEAPDGQHELTPRILIIEASGLVVGVRADQVLGVEPWSSAVDQASLPESMGGKLRTFSRGAQWAPGGVVVLLDIERILEESAVR